MTDWDARFLDAARFIAGWSKDPSTQVGAVIARPDKTLASVGYNGFPRNVHDDDWRYENREIKYKMIVHAEANAILTAHEPAHGCTLYVWPFMPCSTCAGMIIQAGIQRVVAPDTNTDRWAESFKLTRTMFEEAGVQLNLRS